jgi:hypothetical protein
LDSVVGSRRQKLAISTKTVDNGRQSVGMAEVHTTLTRPDSQSHALPARLALLFAAGNAGNRDMLTGNHDRLTGDPLGERTIVPFRRGRTIKCWILP